MPLCPQTLTCLGPPSQPSPSPGLRPVPDEVTHSQYSQSKALSMRFGAIVSIAMVSIAMVSIAMVSIARA